MLVKLLRVFTWLWASYALLANAAALVGAFTIIADPRAQLTVSSTPSTGQREVHLISSAGRATETGAKIE